MTFFLEIYLKYFSFPNYQKMEFGQMEPIGSAFAPPLGRKRLSNFSKGQNDKYYLECLKTYFFFQTTSKMQEHQMDTIENAITLSFGG